jgi:hypothetical protein
MERRHYGGFCYVRPYVSISETAKRIARMHLELCIIFEVVEEAKAHPGL